MGGVVSTGTDNDDLINNLLHADYIKTARVEKVFRAVDRADYFLEESRNDAYKDSAWKNGHLHLSAPCIYSEVMEGLQLKPGLSFLNLGSGTGYLSTMVGLILGPYGTNHGIEIYEDVIQYANKKLENFFKYSAALDEYEFCPPKFVQGNCLCLNSDFPQYDRVYCGAACPENHENYMKNLIKTGGILIMPVNDKLLQIKRTSETTWEETFLLSVSFASLIAPTGNPNEVPKTLDFEPLTLQAICRSTIRTILRNNIDLEHPNLKKTVHTAPKRPKKKRALRRLFVPIFEESDMETSDNVSEEDENRPDFARVRLNPSENHGGREITSILDLVLGSLTSRNRERNVDNQNLESDSENESNESNHAPHESQRASTESDRAPSDSRSSHEEKMVRSESERSTYESGSSPDLKMAPREPNESLSATNESNQTQNESNHAQNESKMASNESKEAPNESQRLQESNLEPDDSKSLKNEFNTIKYEPDSPSFDSHQSLDASCESKMIPETECPKTDSPCQINESNKSHINNVNHELSIVWDGVKKSTSQNDSHGSCSSKTNCDDFNDKTVKEKCDCAVSQCDSLESVTHEVGCSAKIGCDIVSKEPSETYMARDDSHESKNDRNSSNKALNLVEFLQLDDIRVSNDNRCQMSKNKREKFDSGIGDEKWSSDSENANQMEIDSDNDSDSEKTSNNRGKSSFRPNISYSGQKLQRFSMRSYVESDSDSDMILDDCQSSSQSVHQPVTHQSTSPYTNHMRSKIQALPLPNILKLYLNLYREF